MATEPRGGRERGRGQEVPPRRTDYIAPGLYRWMLDDTLPPSEGRTISSIAELRELEKREKKEEKELYRKAVLHARDSLDRVPPCLDSLKRTHRHCKLCQIRIQRREMWRHPFQSALSIYRSWKTNRAFRKRMTADLAEREKHEGGRFRG